MSSSGVAWKFGSCDTISSYLRAPSIGFHENVGEPVTTAALAGAISVGPTCGRSNDWTWPEFGLLTAPEPFAPVDGSTTQ